MGGVCGFRYNNSKYYYEKNLQGDITAIYDESGDKKAEYQYDAWGNHTIVADIDGIGTLNPFRYRGYYYDTETGLYYLNSRYYDPQTGRFINADKYVSAGQNMLGYNMFGYCGNSPVNRIDPNGHLWLAALLVTTIVLAATVGLSGCSPKEEPTSDVGAAREYEEVKGSKNPNSPNCYAFAIGSSVNEQPGATSGRHPKDDSDVRDVGKSVEADLKKKGYSVRTISGPDAKVYENEYKIALRVGTKPYAYDWFTGRPLYDYHFMVQTSTGQWAEKHGTSGNSILHDVGMTPDNIPWTLSGMPYYDSEIIYYAIEK